MIRLRDLRLIPIAMVASTCLLVLVAADLVLGRYGTGTSDDVSARFAEPTVIHAIPGVPRGAEQKSSWAQQMFNYPDANPRRAEQADFSFLPPIPPLSAGRNNDITGSVSAQPAAGSAKESPGPTTGSSKQAANKEATGKETTGKETPGKEAQGPKDPPPSPNGTVISLTPQPGPSAAERAILEHLQERRQELDKRARELDIREGLIAEAERRLDAKLAEIKENEAHLVVAAQKKEEAEAAQLKGLVTMYETMKPKEAAKIFDHLEVGVLLQVASLINPRVMSAILAQMTPDRAEQLTVELASRAQGSPKNIAAGLPKIEGRPTAQ